MRNRLVRFLLALVMMLTLLPVTPAFAVSDARAQALAYQKHSLGLTGVPNARDMGGYRTKDGRTIKFGKLFRTGELTDMTAADKKKLVRKYHLVKDIDFRSARNILTDGDSRHICLSHSGPVTVLAVSDEPVGVDLEHVGEAKDAIVTRFFPESFRQELEDASEADRPAVFFRLWTRLEAALKADGRGLTAPRSEFEEILERYDIETEQRNDLIWSIATEK